VHAGGILNEIRLRVSAYLKTKEAHALKEAERIL
jgi:hypothetical protein